jgi:hypothetical protein
MKVVIKGEFKSSKVNLRNSEEIKLDVYLEKLIKRIKKRLKK